MSRVALSAVLSAGLLGVTGCVFSVDQGQDRFPADTEIYRDSAGDGVNIAGVGPLSVRNVLVVANEAGTEGNLIAAIVNNTDEDHVLRIMVGEASDTELRIPVPAETTVSFGQRRGLDDPPLIENLDAVPGSTVRMYFQAGDAEGVVENIPVLDECLDYLDGLEPRDRSEADDCPPG